MAFGVSGFVSRYDAAPVEEPGVFLSYGLTARLSIFWGSPSEPQRRSQ